MIRQKKKIKLATEQLAQLIILVGQEIHESKQDFAYAEGKEMKDLVKEYIDDLEAILIKLKERY